MSDQEKKDNPEDEKQSYEKPNLHTHDPLRDLTGGGPLGGPPPTTGPPGGGPQER